MARPLEDLIAVLGEDSQAARELRGASPFVGIVTPQERWRIWKSTLPEPVKDPRFTRTFGYYAQGIDISTATLPEGWRERLVRIQNPNTGGHAGWCLEIHDLLISKCVAGRPKDIRFLREVLRAGLAATDLLLERLETTPIEGGAAGSDCPANQARKRGFSPDVITTQGGSEPLSGLCCRHRRGAQAPALEPGTAQAGREVRVLGHGLP